MILSENLPDGTSYPTIAELALDAGCFDGEGSLIAYPSLPPGQELVCTHHQTNGDFHYLCTDLTAMLAVHWGRLPESGTTVTWHVVPRKDLDRLPA